MNILTSLLVIINFLILVLRQPLFSSAIVNEGELLTIACLTRNIPSIITFEVFDPNGLPVTTVLGVFRVPNVTRAYAGTYTCIVRSNRDNSTVSVTSTVVIQCELFNYVSVDENLSKFNRNV